jgi:hypothetical protein
MPEPPTDLAVWVGGVVLTALGGLLVFFVTRLFSGKDKAEAERKDADSKKLDAVLEKIAHVEQRLEVIAERFSAQSGRVEELKARIDGVSSNHGPRIAKCEQDVVELRTRVDGLGRKPR